MRRKNISNISLSPGFADSCGGGAHKALGDIAEFLGYADEGIYLAACLQDSLKVECNLSMRLTEALSKQGDNDDTVPG